MSSKFDLTKGPTLEAINATTITRLVSRIEPWQPEFAARGYIRVYCDDTRGNMVRNYQKFEGKKGRSGQDTDLYNNHLMIDSEGNIYCLKSS